LITRSLQTFPNFSVPAPTPQVHPMCGHPQHIFPAEAWRAWATRGHPRRGTGPPMRGSGSASERPEQMRAAHLEATGSQQIRCRWKRTDMGIAACIPQWWRLIKSTRPPLTSSRGNRHREGTALLLWKFFRFWPMSIAHEVESSWRSPSRADPPWWSVPGQVPGGVCRVPRQVYEVALCHAESI
jgi:hypothetical protein